LKDAGSETEGPELGPPSGSRSISRPCGTVRTPRRAGAPVRLPCRVIPA